MRRMWVIVLVLTAAGCGKQPPAESGPTDAQVRDFADRFTAAWLSTKTPAETAKALRDVQEKTTASTIHPKEWTLVIDDVTSPNASPDTKWYVRFFWDGRHFVPGDSTATGTGDAAPTQMSREAVTKYAKQVQGEQ